MTKRAPSNTELLPRRWWWVFLGAGTLLLLAGVGFAIVYSLMFALDAPGGLSLPFVDEYPTVVEVVLPAFVCLLLGGCLVFLGELLRRGTITQGEKTNVAVFRPLSPVFHIMWLLIAVAAWAIIMFGGLNAVGSVTTGSDSARRLDADSDAIFLIAVYAGLAAMVAGALAGSLFKKVWYASAIRRLGPPETTSPFWWHFSYYWRGDVWLVALGALLLGLSPLPMFFDDAPWIVVTLGAGSLLLVIGLVACAQYRRAGMPLGTGSSLTGGFDTLLRAGSHRGDSPAPVDH